jgi:hypothetical protein
MEYAFAVRTVMDSSQTNSLPLPSVSAHVARTQPVIKLLCFRTYMSSHWQQAPKEISSAPSVGLKLAPEPHAKFVPLPSVSSQVSLWQLVTPALTIAV